MSTTGKRAFPPSFCCCWVFTPDSHWLPRYIPVGRCGAKGQWGWGLTKHQSRGTTPRLHPFTPALAERLSQAVSCEAAPPAACAGSCSAPPGAGQTDLLITVSFSLCSASSSRCGLPSWWPGSPWDVPGCLCWALDDATEHRPSGEGSLPLPGYPHPATTARNGSSFSKPHLSSSPCGTSLVSSSLLLQF